MGLPAPPPMPAAASTTASSSSDRRPIPEWQRDPHGWIDYGGDDNDNNNNNNKGHHRRPKDARVFVQLCNLQTRAELNGQLGLVVGYEPSVKRYRVQLTTTSFSNHASNNNNNTNNNKILSLAPSNVRRAHVGQQILGQVQILASQRHVIYHNLQGWIKGNLPPGLVAGHMGPTDAQLANLTQTLLWTAVMTMVVALALLVYVTKSFTKAMVATAFAMTTGRVCLGPVAQACHRKDDNVSSQQQQPQHRRLQVLGQNVWFNLVEFIGEVAPMPSFWKQSGQRRPSVAWVLFVTALWCVYVAFTLSR